jgi:hypothetical protein
VCRVLGQQALALLLARAAAPGSAVQRQYYSFLATQLKLRAWRVRGGCWPQIFFAVADSAAALLVGGGLEAESEQKLRDQVIIGVGAVPQLPAPLTGAAAISLLPSLVIIGRFLLCMHASMTDDSLGAGQWPTQCLGPDGNKLCRLLCAWWFGFLCQAAAAVAAGSQRAAGCCRLHSLPGSTAAAPAALEGVVAESVFGMCQHLQLAGLALCSLPVPCLCNNPACTNTAGLTELRLVSGRSCICAGCHVARYCSRACQRICRKQHKPLCSSLAAAAAAPELPASPSGMEDS